MSRRERIRDKITANSHEEPAPDFVDPARGPCRIWDGGTSGNGRGGGYPRMTLDGGTVAVHIASWVNEHGLIPPRKELDHVCRVRLCVSDEHLDLVTRLENERRKQAALRYMA